MPHISPMFLFHGGEENTLPAMFSSLPTSLWTRQEEKGSGRNLGPPFMVQHRLSLPGCLPCLPHPALGGFLQHSWRFTRAGYRLFHTRGPQSGMPCTSPTWKILSGPNSNHILPSFPTPLRVTYSLLLLCGQNTVIALNTSVTVLSITQSNDLLSCTKKTSILSIDYRPLEQGRWASCTLSVPGAHGKFERIELTQLPSPPPPVSSPKNHLNRSLIGCQVLVLGSLYFALLSICQQH